MANKTLTAKVRFDTRSAEANLTRLSKKINAINNALNKKVGKTGLDTQISKARIQQEKLRQATLKTQQAELKVTEQKHKTALAAEKVKNATDKSNKSANTLLGTVKRLAGVYLGMQTIGLGIKTSDKITHAENRLNALEGVGPKTTQEYMDKMYASAQRVRMSYTDMISNASKSMTLAGEAFGGNMDNAIRFQEIMQEAYVLGGAEPTEASTSMYQMIQALGAGTLAGDELRSVREGAPLAYKAIEEFAQGIYQTDESLKDLAADGKITSDIVISAIMNAGKRMDEQFENTAITFGQTWDTIVNTAVKAFEPALKKINKLLNSEKGQRLIEGLGNALIILGNITYGVLDVFATFFSWCVDNWEWLKYVVIGALTVIMALMIKSAAVAIVNALITAWAWLQAYWPLLLIVAGIVAILYVYEKWREATISTTEAIIYCLLAIAAVALIAAVIMGSIPLLIVAAVLIALAAILYFFDYISGAVTWFGILCKNIGLEIAGFFKALAWVIANAFMTAVEFVVDIFNGSVSWIGALFTNLGQTIKGIATNIGVAFSNAWNGALSDFWNFIASCMEGLDWLAKPIEAIAELFGKSFDYTSFVDGLRTKADGYSAKQKEYVEWNGFEKGWSGDAWNSGVNKWSAPKWAEDSSWSEMQNSVGGFEKGWSSEAFGIGYNWGSGIQDSINQWGSQFQTKAGDDSYSGIFSDISNLLGGNSLPDINSPNTDITGAWDQPSVDELLSGVGNIKDSMDIADDDLDWMRRIAEMEWRNEFTTAEIKVDMTNNNTVNGDRDLDGIVEYLADVLRDEMTSVANGVHY